MVIKFIKYLYAKEIFVASHFSRKKNLFQRSLHNKNEKIIKNFLSTNHLNE